MHASTHPRFRFWPCLMFVGLLGCSSGETTPAPPTASITSAGDEVPQLDIPSDNSNSQASQDPDHPIVRISTSVGDIVVELDAEKAPITVKNFLWYANSRHYEGTIFHQVVDGYIALGGGYTKDLSEKKSTYITICNEAYNGVSNQRGTIAMARQADAIDSSTCQFFLNVSDNPQLDHKGREKPEEFGYCVFGRVVDGLSVLDRISKTTVTNRDDFVSVPVEPVVIKSVVTLN